MPTVLQVRTLGLGKKWGGGGGAHLSSQCLNSGVGALGTRSEGGGNPGALSGAPGVPGWLLPLAWRPPSHLVDGREELSFIIKNMSRK